MKKIISLLLCLCTVLSVVAIFSSCKKEEGPQVDGETATIDLSGYTVICSDELTNMGRDDTYVMANTLRSMTGISSMRAWEDKEDAPVDTEDLEILVGETNRTQSVNAKKEIKNHGWIISVDGCKIVILGTTPLLTQIAVQYFRENYMTETAVQGTSITLNRKVLNSDVKMVELARDGVSNYAIVYDDGVDDFNNRANGATYDYASDENPNGGPDVDAVFTYCEEIKELLATTTGAKRTSIDMKKTSVTATTGEILIGNMNRSEYKAQANKLLANEYGVAVQNGTIMLLAWNDVTLKLITPLLQDMLEGSKTAGGTYMMPANCFMKEQAKSSSLKADWKVDFPKPEGEGIQLDGTVDVGTNSLEYIYTGAGVNAAAYNAYCTKLEAAGYTVQKGSANQMGNDLFRMYVNESQKVALYVYLSTYSYAAQYNDTESLPGIRIIATGTDNKTLPSEAMLDATAYNNRTYLTTASKKTGITQMKLNYAAGSFGNSYFYTLADGTFVVYDGGSNKGATDSDNIWDCLNAAYKLVHGTEPTTAKPIHIRAWLLSHEHMDHYSAFRDFCKDYGKESTLRLDALLFNPVSASQRVNSNNPEATVQNNIATFQGYVTGGFDLVKVHTGQTFYFVNLKLEVLYTHEDAYPKRLEYFNNSSTIFRGTLKTEDASGNPTESTMIWMGDSERIGGRRIMAAYGTGLKSDMVQVAHHGHTAVHFIVYQLIAPDVVWWPASISNYRSYISNKNHAKWYYRVDYQIAYELDSADLILIADTYNTTMFITGTQADWSSLIDLSGSTVTYTDVIRASSNGAQGTAIRKNNS